MQIALTGATGFVGRAVIRESLRRGHEVVGFTRTPSRIIHDCIETRRFSIDKPPDLRGCDAVVHLAGESIAGWWSRKKKERIRSSRVQGTRRLVEAIRAMPTPPEVMVCASATGFYGDCGEAELTEDSPAGKGFLSEVCQAWESEARAAMNKCRVVSTRFGIVLGNDGGALPPMASAFRLGIGGPLGNGAQWWSWIHVDDVASLIVFALENMEAQGAINATSPWPVRNAGFTKQLASILHRPAFFHVPAFLLRGLLRDLGRELLSSRRVIPERAAELEFPFRHPELAPALGESLRS